MSSKEAETKRQSPSRCSRAYAPAALVSAAVLAVILAFFLATAIFTTSVSRADGPPILGGAFTLPFKLEQGRPAPVRASSGPRQAPTPTTAATPPPTEEPPTGPPGTPTARAYPIAYSIIEIEWDQPEGHVDGFEVQVSSDGGSTWRLLAGKSTLTDPAGRLYTWTQQYGLQVNLTRHYRVRAGNGDEWSGWSDAVSATTYSTSEPDLRVDPQGKNALKITWEMPSAAATITGWTLEVTEDAPPPETVTFTLPIGSPSGAYRVRPPRTQSNQTWTRLATPEAGDRSYTHSGLEPGDTRYYRIRAVTDGGTGSWSAGPDHATTHTDSIPAAPVLTARADGALEIDLSWTKPDGRGFPITEYEWQESPDGKAWGRSWSSFAPDTYSSPSVDRPGTTRYFRVRAKTVQGLGPWSRTVKVTTENGGAGAPTNLEVVDVGTTWIKLEWQAPAQVGAGITGYQVQRIDPTSGRDVWKNVGTTGASKLTFTDTGLVSAEFYQHRVAARDSGGLGPWATTQSGGITEPLLPAAPKLTARAMTLDGGPGQNDNPYHQWVELTWTEPTTVYGYPQQFDYRVERSADGKNGWALAYFGDSDTYKDHDVKPGETWHHRVQAKVQGTEYGPWSNVVSATVRAALPENLPYMTAGTIGERSIEINWQPPNADGGSSITRYEIQFSTEGYRDDSKFKALTSPSASASTYTHRNLTPETEYCYRYRAKNSVGWSEWQGGHHDGQCFRTGSA